MVSFFTYFAAGQCQDKNFLSMVPWYHYINLNSSCGFDSAHPFVFLGTNSDLLLILLAVVDDLMRLAGLVAVIFVIYAGVKYITSQGSPDEIAKAQSTLINSLIGLVIALVAVAIVSYIGNQFTSAGSAGVTGIGLDLGSLPNVNGVDNGSVVRTALTIVFGLVGVLSLLFVVIGGSRYVASQGDPNNVSRAKNTIMYSLIGLVVAIVAESIVSLVIGKV